METFTTSIPLATCSRTAIPTWRWRSSRWTPGRWRSWPARGDDVGADARPLTGHETARSSCLCSRTRTSFLRDLRLLKPRQDERDGDADIIRRIQQCALGRIQTVV